jgi:hypothetical protein
VMSVKATVFDLPEDACEPDAAALTTL